MCRVIEEVFAEELAAGKQESEKIILLDSIRNLMETMK